MKVSMRFRGHLRLLSLASYCTVLYCTALHCTVLYCTVLYCTVLYCRWGVYQHDPEEEHPRPEYLAQLERVEARTLNPVTRTLEPRPPFWGMQVLPLYCLLLYCTVLYHTAP